MNSLTTSDEDEYRMDRRWFLLPFIIVAVALAMLLPTLPPDPEAAAAHAAPAAAPETPAAGPIDGDTSVPDAGEALRRNPDVAAPEPYATF